jgi:hypothetical protein
MSSVDGVVVASNGAVAVTMAEAGVGVSPFGVLALVVATAVGVVAAVAVAAVDVVVSVVAPFVVFESMFQDQYCIINHFIFFELTLDIPLQSFLSLDGPFKKTVWRLKVKPPIDGGKKSNRHTA